MRTLLLFQRLLEADGSPILSLIFGDGEADFSWRSRRSKAKTHGPRNCEVASNEIADSAVSSGTEPTEVIRCFPGQFGHPHPGFGQEPLIVAMPRRQGT